MTLSETDLLSVMRDRGENPALPYLFFSLDGKLLLANPRALKILEITQSLPIKKSSVQEIWQFYNEEMAGPATLERVLTGLNDYSRDKSKSRSRARSLLVQLGLKSFRLRSYTSKSPAGVLVICELVRKGDLMQDKESRQHLFRVLAHEIRTSAQVLGSYVEMTKSHDPALAARMEEGVKRLERAVALLKELKSELEL